MAGPAGVTTAAPLSCRLCLPITGSATGAPLLRSGFVKMGGELVATAGSGPSRIVGRGVGMTVGIETVGQILVSLLKVMYWSQSVTTTSGMPIGDTVVEQTALTVGANNVWQPESSIAMWAFSGSLAGWLMGLGKGMGVVVRPLEKTVDEPLGNKAVALMVGTEPGMLLRGGKGGKMVKTRLSVGCPGQRVTMGSCMVEVGKTGIVSLGRDDWPRIGTREVLPGIGTMVTVMFGITLETGGSDGESLTSSSGPVGSCRMWSRL